MATPGGSDGASKGEHLQPSTSSSSINGATTEPTSLTIEVLRKSTDNFSEKRKIGQGSYGKVYRGTLENGEEIAVKLLHNTMQDIDDVQFQHEFNNLMMLKHKNTIRLVGYCYETQRQHVEHKGKLVFGEMTYRALCFEYMHFGSLEKHLYDETLGDDWQTRYKIIKGTCEGLKYLHEGLKEPIYHLDLKPDNILLDKNMLPKLADFGLSKLFDRETTKEAESSRGTIGYMPTEYLSPPHVISKKFDIFSLGVIITKIIAGPEGHTRSAEMPCQEFLHQVRANWRKRLEDTCIPKMLEAKCQQVSICTDIGLRCMDDDRHKRPSVLEIIDKLDATETVIEKFIYNQEALSILFCRQTADNALKSVDSHEDYKLLKIEESPKSFRDISDTLLGSIVTMYDTETEKYDRKVRDNERQYMVDKLMKVFNEDSRELIRKMMGNTCERFKVEYARNIKNMEETDTDITYDDEMVDSCVEEFIQSCEDLMVFDLGYLHMKCAELKNHIHLYTIHQILTLKEIRGRRATLLAQQRYDKNMEEMLKRWEDAAKEKQHTEAEIKRLKEKNLMDESEYSRRMLAERPET